MSRKVTNLSIHLQNGTDRTLYATWNCNEGNLKEYQLRWDYYTGNKNVWFIGSETTTTHRQATYNAPNNATAVSLRIKPISKTYKANGADTTYFTGEWSKWAYYYFTANMTPDTPSVPTVSVDGYTLTASVDVYDTKAYQIVFGVWRDDVGIKTIRSTVKGSRATMNLTISPGYEYKVRCRAASMLYKYSPWTQFSNIVTTAAGTPRKILWVKAKGSDANGYTVEVLWSTVRNADSYVVEYTTNKSHFDRSSDVQSTTFSESCGGTAYISGLAGGQTWYFRVKATNSVGDSKWTAAKSIVLGSKPDAPTTWSETTTAVIGESVNLYWVHNSVDGSAETSAQVQITINGRTTTYDLENSSQTTVGDDNTPQTRSYTVNTQDMSQGSAILWKVRTKGVVNAYGPWSTQRKIIIYEQPRLEFAARTIKNWQWDPFNFTTDTIYNTSDSVGGVLDQITTFPFYVRGVVSPSTQHVVSYSLTITALESYIGSDYNGEDVVVAAGEDVLSRYYAATSNNFLDLISAGDVRLGDSVNYRITLKASLDSGLSCEAYHELPVDFADQEYEPDAEIGIDPDNYSAFIRPFCADNNGDLISDVILSIYRREYDGSFKLIEQFVENINQSTIVDPHPALDFARYRIVSMSKTTGIVNYSDLPGYPVNEPAIIIQWDEKFHAFDAEPDADAPSDDIDILSAPLHTGSMLRLPYNVDVSDSYAPDVAFANYIGREHPVSYYGTQRGVTASWNTEIPANDKETIFALRRLAAYMGDVYVREPSGIGYWAQVTVSFSIAHNEVTIPVSFNITRVEGGI